MPDQNGARAVVALGSLPDGREDTIQRGPFVFGVAERMGNIDAGDFQRFGIDFRAFEGDDVRGMDLADGQLPAVVKFNRRGGDFKQGVPIAIKTAGFHIDYHR